MEDADVAMPSLSTHELARNKRRVCYDEDSGEILHPDGNDPSKLLGAHGVYFMNMLIPKVYFEKPSPDDLVCNMAAEHEDILVPPKCCNGGGCPCHEHQEPGFGRPGRP